VVEFGYRMYGNKNNKRPMSDKQEDFIRNLLEDKIISEDYPGYAGYIQKLLQSDSNITMKKASCIIDTLKEMIDIENNKEQSGNSIENDSEEITVEKIE
jgi:hypothetical protein